MGAQGSGGGGGLKGGTARPGFTADSGSSMCERQRRVVDGMHDEGRSQPWQALRRRSAGTPGHAAGRRGAARRLDQHRRPARGGGLVQGGARQVLQARGAAGHLARGRGRSASFGPESHVMAAVRSDADLAGYREAMALIVEDPEIQGGVATFKGTRLLVHHIAGLIAQGISEQELAEDYPHLTGPMREAAVVYAKAHPFRGQTRKPGWRGARPIAAKVYPAGDI